jgi:hypothetical protein
LDEKRLFQAVSPQSVRLLQSREISSDWFRTTAACRDDETARALALGQRAAERIEQRAPARFPERGVDKPVQERAVLGEDKASSAAVGGELDCRERDR